jgi:hypothetical protein
LIPLAIAVLTDLYSNKDGKNPLSELDFRIILDQVFRIKKLLLYSALIFIPFIFWENFNGEIKLISLIISIIGILLVVKIIIDIYNWVRGNVFTYRIFYLKSLKKIEDHEIAWRSVWQVKDLDRMQEREFFNIFSIKIDGILKSKQFSNLTVIFNHFFNTLENRTYFFIWNPKVFEKTFEWNFIIWKAHWQNIGKLNDETGNLLQLATTAPSIVRKIAMSTLKEKYAFSELFMKAFQRTVEGYKDEKITIGKRQQYYLSDLFGMFYKIIFEFEEVADYGEKDYMWDNFPNQWKVTKDNLLDKNYIISKISLYEFLEWMNQRFSVKSDFDSQLNDVQINLFPEADPETWANILVFAQLPYDPDNRIRSVISFQRNFGYDFHAIVFTSLEDKKQKEMEREKMNGMKIQKTYELALLIFANEFTRDKLDKYIAEITRLKYPDASVEEHRLEKYKEILIEMRKLVQ